VSEGVFGMLFLNATSFLTQIVYARPQTVFERMAELWNSSAFYPSAPSSSCHEDFMSSTDCSYDLVSALISASPQRVQEFLRPCGQISFKLFRTGRPVDRVMAVETMRRVLSTWTTLPQFRPEY
jgi:hypothetical protein